MYLPKSKISSPKFSNGNLLVKSNNKSYTGWYYETSAGQFYSGKSPSNSSVELISTQDVSSSPNEFTLPTFHYPKPTDDDYKRGILPRYFMKKRNANYTNIIEISKKDYDNFNTSQGSSIDTSLYVLVKLNWKITGPLYDDFRDKNFPKAGIIPTNQRLVKEREKVYPGFSLYFTDYAQFAKPN